MWKHYCPGCGHNHTFYTEGNVVWDYNKNPDNPTVSPSIKHTWGDARSEQTCHYFIIDGKIHYCNDCTHGLSGEVVDMDELPEMGFDSNSFQS